MKYLLFTQAFILFVVVAKNVYDLDNFQEVALLQAEGLQIDQVGDVENLQVSSSSASSAYSWILDRDDCSNIVDIRSGFIDPITNDFGSEVFTLYALAEGQCTFQIAYANPREFVSFEEHKRTSGLVIDFPIFVGKQKQNAKEKIDCFYERQHCSLKIENNITQRVESRFRLMDSQAWMRAFTTPGGLFVWFPQAIVSLRAQQGSYVAARRFVSITKWWANIGGWLFFPATIAVLSILTDYAFWYPEEDEEDRRLLSPKVFAHNNAYFDEYQGDYYWFLKVAAGIIMITLDVVGWILFYVSYKDAIRYGNYLVLRNSRDQWGLTDDDF